METGEGELGPGFSYEGHPARVVGVLGALQHQTVPPGPCFLEILGQIAPAHHLDSGGRVGRAAGPRTAPNFGHMELVVWV